MTMLKLSNMKYTIEQLNLLIHNCDVYHLSSDIKQKYIDMLECLYIMGFQFIPFPIVCLYVKYFSKHIEIRNYSQIHESCIRNINKAKKIEDEMEETERGCCSLDNIIDDM